MKQIRLTINGLTHEFVLDKDRVLLDLLREDLALTGTKQSCDRKGECGACTVIVNEKAVLSCLVKVSSLNNAHVITVEGLGTPKNPHLIQEAFALAGAIQCGFCTPGMIMAAKALLDRNRNPDADAIKKALRNNLCRCTGYKKIIEAVQLAGSFLRGETTPDDVRPKPSDGFIGISHPRPSALPKACGTAHFTADIKIGGALELAVLRSTVAHARIASIDSSEALKINGVAGVLTADDIKGTNALKLQQPDRPVLCKDKVRYIGDPILAVAAETKSQAEAALERVRVTLEPLPVLSSPEAALADDAPQVHDDRPNLCADQPVIKGNAAEAFCNSVAVIEARFTTQVNHMAALEPEAALAYWEDEGEAEDPKLVIIGRSINIHHQLNMLQEALGWENMAYVEAYSGGQFGIKIDVTSEGIAGAAAIRFRRAVRYIPSLAESILMTSKRHKFDMNVKLAADAQGKLTAYSNHFFIDKGAYYSSGGVLSRSLSTLHGSYNIPNVDASAKMVYTNNPYGSAARGAGQPQVSFALECAMDMLADKLGMDPFELRLRNSLKPGETTVTGWTVPEWPFPEIMHAIQPHYERAVKEAAAHNKEGIIKRGVGLATGAHGIGRTADHSLVAVELDADGGISVFAGAADPGEGNDSMLAQLTAQFMGVPMDKIRLHTRNTDNTTSTGPAAGSRITYMVGGALLKALGQLKTAMQETGAQNSEQLASAGKRIRYLGEVRNEGTASMDPKTGQGASFVTHSHSVQLVELEVNTETGEVKILKMTTAVDAGTVINPQNLTGQLEGGIDQGIGYALREEYIAGKTLNWTTFKFPRIRNTFEMESILVETPRKEGPMGATGIGEMCLVPTTPAVINAIKDAVGVWICDLPATPEKIKAALAAR